MDICITLFHKTLKGHVLILLSTTSEYSGTLQPHRHGAEAVQGSRLPACGASRAAVQAHSLGKCRLCPSCKCTRMETQAGDACLFSPCAKTWVLLVGWDKGSLVGKANAVCVQVKHKEELMHCFPPQADVPPRPGERGATTHNGYAIAPNVPAPLSSPPAFITSTLHSTG